MRPAVSAIPLAQLASNSKTVQVMKAVGSLRSDFFPEFFREFFDDSRSNVLYLHKNYC